MAAEIAGDLSAAGVVVVSGLAKGIDGAAHTGVVRRTDRVAEPVAVVGTGLDVTYPRNQSDLWMAVGEQGAVVSEQPLGTLPRQRVFPARNRIIAALSDVVVVVESHLSGGSLYTADAAARRGIPVGAVPGSVRSAASSGSNALIAGGCFPVRDAADVLCAIELVRAEPVTPRLSPRQGARHLSDGMEGSSTTGDGLEEVPTVQRQCRPPTSNIGYSRLSTTTRPGSRPSSCERDCPSPLSLWPATISSSVRRWSPVPAGGHGPDGRRSPSGRREAAGLPPDCRRADGVRTGRGPERRSGTTGQMGLSAVPGGGARRRARRASTRRPATGWRA